LSVGFLGAGQMATALLNGLLTPRAGDPILRREKAYLSDVSSAALQALKQSLPGINTASNLEIASNCEVLVLAVKPHVVQQVLKEISPKLNQRHLIISIAAGLQLKTLESYISSSSPIRVVRVMPNTPALVACGASAYSLGTHATEADGKLVCKMFEALGVAFRVEESKLDVVTGVSGSGPAYVFLFIEALADGGVRMGLPRDQALALAAHTVAGAAKLLLETGKHPGVLKDGVCSAGGTTIAGVHALELGGLRGAVMNAVVAATQRSIEMGKVDQAQPKSKL